MLFSIPAELAATYFPDRLATTYATGLFAVRSQNVPFGSSAALREQSEDGPNPNGHFVSLQANWRDRAGSRTSQFLKNLWT